METRMVCGFDLPFNQSAYVKDKYNIMQPGNICRNDVFHFVQTMLYLKSLEKASLVALNAILIM